MAARAARPDVRTNRQPVEMLLLFEGLKHDPELKQVRSGQPWKVHRKSAAWVRVDHFSLEDHWPFIGKVDRQLTVFAGWGRCRGLKKTSAKTEIGEPVESTSRSALPQSIQRDSDSWMAAAFDDFSHGLLDDYSGRNSHAGWWQVRYYLAATKDRRAAVFRLLAARFPFADENQQS